MNMKNENLTIDNKNFVRLPRSLKEFYLDRYINFEQFFVLLWLWIKANPVTGKVDTSYEALRKDFHEKFSKNYINKIMLALKEQKLIWYPNQRGRRSSFNVDIQNYPLSNGGYRDINKLFEQESGRSSDSNQDSLLAEAPAEVKPSRQKSEGEILALNKAQINRFKNNFGRTYKNENEKEKENYKNRSASSNEIDVDNYNPASTDEQECVAIAIYLQEQKLNFILSALSRYGIEIIRKVYWEVVKRQDVIKNRGAYFNRMVENFAKNEFDE
jgi:hypothetical protein